MEHILLLASLIKVLSLHSYSLILSVHNWLLIRLFPSLILLTSMTLIAGLVLNPQMPRIDHLILRCTYLLLTKEISINLRIQVSFEEHQDRLIFVPKEVLRSITLRVMWRMVTVFKIEVNFWFCVVSFGLLIKRILILFCFHLSLFRNIVVRFWRVLVVWHLLGF